VDTSSTYHWKNSMRSAAAALLLVLSACADPFTPRADAHGVRMEVHAPTSVRVHQPFEMWVTVTNLRATEVNIRTSDLCKVIFRIEDAKGRVSMVGTDRICRLGIGGWTLPPGGSEEVRWSVRAEYTEPAGAPVPRGRYTIRVIPRVIEIDGQPAELPELTRALRVE
jgi:hypothetical protein